MINAIIVDDEAHCVERLQMLLATHCGEKVRLLDSCSSIVQAEQRILQLAPELVFLDVQLEGRTGFELLQKINAPSLRVIFTTAYEQYAVTAFRFSAVDYLLKPVGPSELVNSVDKLISSLDQQEAALKYEALFHNLQAGAGGKKIALPTQEGLEFVNINEVVRCQASGNYTQFFLSDGRHLMVSRTMKEFEELLEKHNFFRVHYSHLVNLDYVKKYNRGKGGYVLLADNSELEVSVRRKEAFLKKMAGGR
ncbi:DNA-binding response regulator [Chitinophaga alhagiae]|uniref:DNA-binding response regulator n=1 Tax=Chitinophaga alhagiae TaxID=2203219 RepID=A0ABM6WAS2_9BACT|nr:LytTR family DNA-binding domain-containing protein [Chitinophaga alhagiae]AWO01058.1 DNA-binding response regulator [Chitinophaga alhagiae]